MKLALIQLMASDMAHFRETLDHIRFMIDEAVKEIPDLILLPECAFPAYCIGLDEAGAWENDLELFLEMLSEEAARHNVYLVCGAAVRKTDGSLVNGAVVFDRAGRQIELAEKSNLWHFDSKWFLAGRHTCLFDTEFGRIGVMVCADGRIPELAEMLVRKGAQLILDTVNLVAAAERPELLNNQQYSFILQVRAKENGVPIAVCNKCGVESGLVVYLGRSFVTDENGSILKELPPDREDILTIDVNLPPAREIPVPGPEYETIWKPTDKLLLSSVLKKRYDLSRLNVFTSTAAFEAKTKSEYLQKAMEMIERSFLADAELILLPECRFSLSNQDRKALTMAVGVKKMLLLPLADENNSCLLCISSHKLRKVLYPVNNKNGSFEAAANMVVFKDNIRIAALFGKEIEQPMIARAAALEGADILVWIDREAENDFRRKWMQTRAAENKVFVLRAGKDRAFAVNPDGAQIFTTIRSTEQAACGFLNTALSKSKDVVPGTNILTGRIPEFYKEVTNE